MVTIVTPNIFIVSVMFKKKMYPPIYFNSLMTVRTGNSGIRRISKNISKTRHAHIKTQLMVTLFKTD